MTNKLKLAVTILLVILIGLALIGGCQPPPPPPPDTQATAAFEATAAFGAGQFHIQLTAIATQGANP